MTQTATPTDTIDLYKLRNLVALAAFAAEARRVLTEIDLCCEIFPSVNAQLSQHIEARRQWSEIPDTLSSVLMYVHSDLDDALSEK